MLIHRIMMTAAADSSDNSLIPTLVGVIIAMGGGAGILKLAEGLWKIRQGMSAKESERKVDIVRQRDDADRKRRKAIELAATYRVMLLANGVQPGQDDAFEYVQRPLEGTKTAQPKELREGERP